MSESPKQRVGIDSMTLVWGVRKDGPQEQKRRAKYLFDALEEDDAQIVVPSIAAAEYLTPVDLKDAPKVMAALSDRFIIAPFDAKCAALAAELFRRGQSGRKMGKPNARKCLRADAMIIATVKVHGGTVFYTEDADCRSLAKGVIMARPFPDMPIDLWGYGDES